MDDEIFEERLQEQKLLLDSIYNTIECGIIRYLRLEGDKCKILTMNQAALYMLGYDTMEECINDGFDGGVASHVVDRDKIKIRSLSKALRKRGDIVKFEYQARTKSGELHWIFASTQFLKEDKEGHPVIQRTMTDMTEKKLLELQLQQEREMYRLALESSADILFEYHMKEDKMFLYLFGEEGGGNQKKVIENYSQEILRGNIVAQEDIPKMSSILLDGGEENFDVRIKTKEGMRWFRVYRKIIFERNAAVRIVGTMHDVQESWTELKESQERQEELKMNRLAVSSFSNQFAGSYFADLCVETYHVLRMPENLQDVLRWQGKYSELLKVISSQVAGEEKKKVKEFLSLKYLKKYLNEKTDFLTIECMSIRKEDNEPTWNRIEVKLLSSKKNKPECVNINVLDITGEKQESLRREYDNTLLAYAISDSYDAIYEIGLETDTIYKVVFDGHHIVREKHGKHYSQALRRNVVEILHPDSREEYRKVMDPEYLNSQSEGRNMDFACEFQMKVPEGHYEWFAFSLRSMVRDGSKRILLFIKNVNERKQRELKQLETEQRSKEAMREAYEAANRANEAKSDFLSRMSHDIRTPLNAIIGMTAIAGAHLDDPERIRDCLKKISASGNLLLNLINEVLDMSKVETGKISLNEEEFSLPDMLQSIIEVIKPNMAEKEQELKVNIENLRHEKVLGDAVRLQQVFMNLISNAVKYTPKGGRVTLRICEQASKQSGIGCYEFVFEDNGIGMSREFIPKLFQPFERAEDSRVSKEQGSGLGMAITQNIVQMMGGTINVESELNRGTRITVNVLLKLSGQEMESIEELKGLPVLVVDDEKDACEHVCMMLRNMGMKEESVLSGSEAVEKVRQAHSRGEDYFAMIVDWKMPGMDGVETTRAIRDTVSKEIPVIILSAYDWTDIEAKARDAGVDGFIPKPLFYSRLVYALKRFLPGSGEHIVADSIDFNESLFAGKRVLLVEDNELNREIAAEVIGMAGTQVEIAENGQEAVDKVRWQPEGYYDLVFMDIQMPVMNGYDATRAIRRLEEGREKKVPIVAMTANAFIEDIQKAKDAGMNEHLAKPLDVGKLMETMRRWLLLDASSHGKT